jgi:TnpA family transposase
MGRAADLSYRELAWATDWYLREETLTAATTAIINYQHRLPIAAAWGTGGFSSSDGQRFPVAVKASGAGLLPPRYGPGLGATIYTHTSDQHSQYATRVVRPTDREATYVLDGILDNTTELDIAEHTTDTAEQTELLFCLTDLLGIGFIPRIRDLAHQRLYRPGPASDYQAFAYAGPLLGHRLNRDRILTRWEDLLRVAGSLKRGTVSASLLISRLQAAPNQNRLTEALREYGRLVKTAFIVRYLTSQQLRRRIQLHLQRMVAASRLDWLVGGTPARCPTATRSCHPSTLAAHPRCCSTANTMRWHRSPPCGNCTGDWSRQACP